MDSVLTPTEHTSRWTFAWIGPIIGLAILYLGLGLFSERVSFGADPDAFRVADTALKLRQGQYEPSRLPGNPLHEALVALVVSPRDGSGAKLLSALFSAGGLVCFGLILKQSLPGLTAPGPFWLLLLGLWPAFLSGTFVTMDYNIGLAFWLCSVWLLRRWEGQAESRVLPVLAGVMAGLAVSCRLSYVLFILGAGVICLVRWIREAENRPVWLRGGILFLLGSLAGVPFFIPLLLRYGLGFLKYYPASNWGWQDFVFHGAKLYLGLAGHLGVLAVLAILFGRELWSGRLTVWLGRRFTHQVLAIFAVGLVLAHLDKPFEARYLLPLVPIGLLYCATRVTARPGGRLSPVMLLLAAGIMSANLITPDAKLVRQMVHDSGRPDWFDGPVIRELRIQRQDRETFQLMTAIGRTGELPRLLRDGYGIEVGDFDLVLLSGYSFYVRRNLWLPGKHFSDFEGGLLLDAPENPRVIIFIPVEPLAGRLLDRLARHGLGRPLRLLVLFRNEASRDGFSSLFQGRPSLYATRIALAR